MKNDQAEYECRVQFYESEGICRSDAQAIVDAEMLTEARAARPTAGDSKFMAPAFLEWKSING